MSATTAATAKHATKAAGSSAPPSWRNAAPVTASAIAAENAGPGLIHTTIARYLGPTYADGGTNVSSSDNPEGVAYYEAAMAASDTETQCENLLAAQKTILERVDMTPLITDTHRYVARSGFATSVFSGYWDISAMRILS